MCTAVDDASSCDVTLRIAVAGTLGHEGTSVGTGFVAVFVDHSDHSELSAASCILHCSVFAEEGEEEEGGLKVWRWECGKVRRDGWLGGCRWLAKRE